MKKINEYKAIILDMDGTLYYQNPLRIKMLFEMILYCFLHPLKIKDLFIVRYYRKIREKEEAYLSSTFIIEQFKIVGEKYHKSEKYVKNVIEYWIYNKPLKYVRKYKDENLISMMNLLKNNGTKIIVYSDYPADEKVKAIELKCDYIFSANDEDILCLKPNTKGLQFILNKLNANNDEVLFIGDRYEKDGQCAKKCKVDYLILNHKKNKRNEQMKEL